MFIEVPRVAARTMRSFYSNGEFKLRKCLWPPRYICRAVGGRLAECYKFIFEFMSPVPL